MKSTQVGLVALAAALVTLSGVSIAARADYAPGNPSVIRDGRASAFTASVASDEQPNTEVEPSIAVNPADPSDVVTAFQTGRHDGGGDADNGWAASLDGGATWPYGGELPGNTAASGNATYGRGSDASVAFGKDPRGYKGYAVYVNNLVFNDSTNPSGMSVNVSLDGGRTFATAAFPEADTVQGLNDKNWIIADNGSGSGHHPGRVYIFWDKEAAALVYSYCDPDVANPAVPSSVAGCEHTYNWSAFTPAGSTLGGPLTPITGIGAFPVVLTDGSVGVAYVNEDAVTCSTTEITDQTCVTPSGNSIAWTVIPGAGSVTWPGPLPSTQAPVTVAAYDSNGITDQRAGGLPQAAVDPTTDAVYVVWEDNRFRTEAGGNQNDPVVSFSTPAAPGALPGVTWSAPARIDSMEPTGNFIDRYNTTVAVGQDGIVRVAYRQRDENPAGHFDITTGRGTPIDTYYQESHDAGATFSAPLLVDTVQGTPDAGYGAFDTKNVNFGLFEGDYEQIAAGGTDESFVSRDEAYAGSPSAAPRDFTHTEGPSAAEWQQTWVSHLGPQLTAATPDVKFVPALLVVGGVCVGFVLWQRRKRSRESSDRE